MVNDVRRSSMDGSESTATLIGNRISSMRGFLRMKQDDLGKALGVTKQTISGYERGRRMPDALAIAKMCSIFGCSADYLLGLVDSPGEVFSPRGRERGEQDDR